MTPGRVIAQRFELLGLAGAGASGTVWRARDRVGGDSVALKIVELATIGLERFAREARVLATLQHPGIVRYVAHGSVDDYTAYLAMDWLEGESLAARLSARGKLALSDSVDLARRIARALGAAHRAGIVHRDIKPGNVFLVEGRSDRPMLLDFGIAHVADSVNPTRTGATLGTAGYLAPEQVGKNAPVTARSDVFSLGCMLYECLSGVAPFAMDSPIAALTKVLLEDPPALGQRLPEAPVALETLISEMLCKESEERPDAALVAERLQAILEQLSRAPVVSRPLAASIGVRAKQVSTAVIVRGATTPELASIRRRLERVLSGVEWRVSGLDGAALELLPSGLDPLERATHAARAALALAGDFPSFQLCLVTAHGGASLMPTPAAPAGVVAIDDATAALLPSSFQVELCEGVRTLRQRLVTRAPRMAENERAPFVGRKRELRVLSVLADSAFDESYPGVAILIGPAGAGKSRLWREVLAELRAAGHSFGVLLCQAEPMRKNSPWSAVGDGIRRYIRLQSDQDLDSARARLDAWLARSLSGAELERAREFIGELVGVPPVEPISPRLAAARADPAVMSFEIERAALDFAQAGGSAPLVFVLEDLQWADISSVQLIDNALRRMRDAPLLVIGTGDEAVFRRFPGLWQSHNPQLIRLEPLAERASRELLGTLLVGSPPERVQQILDRAEGNPLLLYELADASRERPSGELPLGVRALIEQRINQLEPDAQQVLLAASVLGKRFWRGAIERLVVADVADHLDAWLRILERVEVIRRHSDSRFAGQAEYELLHRLIADVAYEMLPADARRAAHTAVADWLEEVGERDVAVIAQHVDRAEDRARAAELWCRAAERALEAHDPKTSLALGQRAAENGASSELLGRVRLVEAAANELAGDSQLAYTRAREAMLLLPQRSGRWYDASRTLTIAAFRVERTAEISPLLDELVRGLHAGDGLPAAVAIATAALSVTLAGSDAVGTRLVAELEKYPELSGQPPVASRIGALRAIVARQNGDLIGYLEHHRASVELLALEPDTQTACTRWNNFGVALRMLGRLDEAREVLQKAEAAAERIGAATIAASARYNLGVTELHRRALPRSLELARRVASEAERAKTTRIQALAHALAARCLLESGDVIGAESEALRAVEIDTSQASTRVLALACLSAVLHSQGRLEEADRTSSDAFALRARSGPLEDGENLVPLVRAEVLWSLGRREEARELLESTVARIDQTAARIDDPALHDAYLHGLLEHERLRELILRWKL